MADRLTEVAFQTLLLLVSELVSNAVRHSGAPAGAPLRVTVRFGTGALRVEVEDPGTGFDPARRSPGDDPESGWGLALVEILSDRWGVDPRPRTRVWFELPG